ncbi:PAS domain-containing protein [Pedobacter sp. MC2016-24]|uniref:PAS domain-containing protein n=1 Tax=Pedobacter sp. MC2016-24 TaxID=2780090 RepID=UPI00187E68C9|nr:PAS domain-containing protein [Pedobacter sp. MC2016-24]MBE9602278.1 PAS domain-containing protein [Pedobacter sp. MC2016-24]
MDSQPHRFTNDKLLEILSLSHNATAIYSGEDITIQTANDAMIGFWGKDRSVIGKPLAEAVPELVGQPFLDVLGEVWRTGVTYEAKDVKAALVVDGRLQNFYFDFIYRAIKNETGEVDCILHTATDVTELNQELEAISEELKSSNEELAAANEELAASNEELLSTNEELSQSREQLEELVEDLADSEGRTRSIIQAAPFPIGVYSGQEMRIIFANESIMDVWGKGRDVIGKLYSEILPELDNQDVFNQLDEVFRTGIPFQARNQRIDLVVLGKPTTFYFNYNFTALSNEAGEIYGVMNTAADVTDVVLAKQQLESSARELATLNEELTASNEELGNFNSELKTLFEQLKISQDETQLAIDAAGLATFDLNPLTGKFTGNSLLKSWFGLPSEAEIELKKAIDVIAEDDRESVVAAITQSMNPALGGDYDISYTIINPLNPEPRIVRAKGKALFNEQQQAIRLSGVLLDVTEQFTSQGKMEQLINSLSASEQKFRLLIQKAPVAINVFRTPQLIIENVNDKMLEIWGKSAEVEGKTFSEALPEMLYQPFVDILNEVFASGTPYFGLENKAIIMSNGVPEERYFNFIYQPVPEEDGKIDSILQVVTEVTEQVNARKEIADMNTRLNIAIDAGGLGSTEVDLATGTMACNAQFKSCYGLTPDQDFTYPELFDAMLPEYRNMVKQLVATAIQNHSVYRAEYEVIWPDGSIHWIKAHGKARYNSDGEAVKMVGIISDVTEAKADEQRKNDFIGMVSHELKTPLTSLSGYVQMLYRRAEKNKDTFTAGALDMAHKQVKKMTTMINGFLNVSRLESGKIHIDRHNFDMAALLKELEEEFNMTVASHQIFFAPVGEILVDADRDKIGQVINNFISNALKYAPSGSRIDIACEKNNNWVQLSVRDEGLGIKKEDQQKLFERFYRVKDQPSTISGFGIGLYLCAEVIHRHEGKIWVESEIGQGSTFYFSLPVS